MQIEALQISDKERSQPLRDTHAELPDTASSRLFDSFGDVPASWREICGKDDLAMDPKVLQVFQRTLADQCRCWGVIVHDAAGLAIGCAALSLFSTELIESNHPAVVRARERLRRMWPGFARMKVLFCGLPVPSGSTHLRVREGASVEAVVAEVDRVMQSLAHTVGGRLTVFKELGDSDAATANTLSRMGYILGDIPPMHLLERPFESFADYRDALKSRYRAQVQRSVKKLKAAGFEVLHGRGSAFFAAHFNEDAHRLYAAVQARAEHKLELMPAAFFLELAAALDDEVSLTLIRRNGRICAFTFAITRGGVHYNMYSGLDYALNHEGDLYFNLFYNDLDQAWQAGATSIHLGQTSDSFKSRLGSTHSKCYFFACARPSWFNAILRLFAPLAFPKVLPVETNDVFSISNNNLHATRARPLDKITDAA
jgi:Acetyltransferase (GNAT) domain